MKLSYQLLKKLILEQLKSEFDLDMEDLRNLAYEKDLSQAEAESLMEILASYIDNPGDAADTIQDYEEKHEIYKKAIYQHFRTEEGQAYSDDSFVNYYEMNNYLGNIDLGAVEIRTELEYPDDPIIDAELIRGSGHFLGMPGFALYRESRESDERNLNRYLQDGNYEMYTYERIKEYLLTPNGKDLLLYYIKNRT